jgi:gas vesicle protein
MIIEEYEDFLPFYSSNKLDENTFELLNNSCKIYESIEHKIRNLLYNNELHTEHDFKVHVIHYDEDITPITDIYTSRGKELRFRVNHKYFVALRLEILFSNKEEISKIIDEHNKSIPIKLEEKYNSAKESLLKRKESNIQYIYKDVDKKILENVAKVEEEYNNKLKEINKRYHKDE